MNKYFLELSYFGFKYSGWQIQKNARTIQEIVEKSLSNLLREEIRVFGCGRTDAGVHAFQHFSHFFSENIKKYDSQDFLFKLNSYLDSDISVKRIFEVPQEADARFSAIKRQYVFFISQTKTPFARGKSMYYYGDLDIPLMNKAGKHLIGEKSFLSFSKKMDTETEGICKVEKSIFVQRKNFWKIEDAPTIEFTIEANRFLRGMVRLIVGTLLQVGIKKMTISEFKTLLEQSKRQKANYSADAKGLYLSEITYPEFVYSKLMEQK